MRSSNIVSAIRGFAQILGAADAAAGALETHRQPPARALNTLGIDPAAFRRIGR